MYSDLHKTILAFFSENTEKEKIKSLGGIAINPQDERKDWQAKAKPMKGMNSTIQTDTGEVVPAKPFGVMPDGGEWEYQWRGTKLDAANGTYTNQGEYNRQKFKQIVQQPTESVQHTSTTVFESKTRLDKIFETVSNILQENKHTRRTRENRAARGDEEAAIADVVLRGFTSPEVTKKAEALERRGERRMGWEEKGSAIRKKAAGIVKARRARTEKK